MDQLQLQWRNMNKKVLEKELRKYGRIISDERYFLKAGERLAGLYIRHFKNIYKNIDFRNLELKETILNFEQYILIPEDEKYLKFDYINRIVLAPSSYIEIDLKFNVINLCIRGTNRKMPDKTTLEEIVYFIREKYNFKALDINLKATLDKLLLTSLIYNYTFKILEEKDMFIAGMFKNAYYDLLMVRERLRTNINEDKKDRDDNSFKINKR